MSDLVVLHETPDSKHGTRPEDRTIQERIRLGVAIVDKPAGPTSHQVSAWVRDMFSVPKAGHSGTLDPRVTGVLPVALADATRAVEAVLAGDKEYVGGLQLHQDVDPRRVRSMMARFVGEIYQVPPVRSAVKREQRTRRVFELEPLEIDGRDVLFRVRCESGTYIRTLAVDLGDALGVGANLVDLRRTRTATFEEADAHPLNAFRDALAFAKEDGDERPVREVLRPIEDLLRHLPRIVIKDTAVDALCHGANLAVPGIAKLSPHIRRGDSVGVLTGKGEAVALSKALMTTDEIVIAKSGAAADTGGRPPPGSRHNPSGDGRRTSPSQWASASVARLLWEASSFGSFRRRPRGGGSWPGSSGSWCPRSWASSRQCSWSRSSIGSGPSLMPPFVVVSKPSRRRQKSQSWACSSCARPRRLGGRTPRSWVSVPRGGWL